MVYNFKKMSELDVLNMSFNVNCTNFEKYENSILNNTKYYSTIKTKNNKKDKIITISVNNKF